MVLTEKRFEIERKYRLLENEYNSLPQTLENLGFKKTKAVIEKDTFLPVEKKGDMLRIRDQHDEDGKNAPQHFLTRKTWVEALGEPERSEHEEEISSFIRDTFLQIMQRIDQPPLRRLSKKRTFFERQEGKSKATVTLDYVQEIGRYSGPYMEIEFLVADKKDVIAARKRIDELAKESLGTDREVMRASYQEMLARSIAEAQSSAELKE